MTELFRGLWVVAYRDILGFLSDRFRIVASLTFPLLFLAIFGAGFSNVIGQMAGGIDIVQFMYPGIIAQVVLTTSLFAGVSIVTDREVGFLREILVAPLSRTGIVLGKAAGAASIALLQVLVLLVIAPIVNVPLEPARVLLLVPTVVVLSLVLSGLGILIGSFARSQQGFQLLMQMLVFPMIFLAGVFFPVDSVPLWMEIASKINPVTYGVDAIRQIFLGSGPAGAGLGGDRVRPHDDPGSRAGAGWCTGGWVGGSRELGVRSPGVRRLATLAAPAFPVPGGGRLIISRQG